MVSFSDIKVVRFKLGVSVKRIYSSNGGEREASEFAHKWGGVHYEYLPGVYRVIF